MMRVSQQGEHSLSEHACMPEPARHAHHVVAGGQVLAEVEGGHGDGHALDGAGACIGLGLEVHDGVVHLEWFVGCGGGGGGG